MNLLGALLVSLVVRFSFLNYESASTRYSAERACAGKPSPLASVDAMRPSVFAAAGETRIRLLRFWKSYTPKGDEKRALPEVGNT